MPELVRYPLGISTAPPCSLALRDGCTAPQQRAALVQHAWKRPLLRTQRSHTSQPANPISSTKHALKILQMSV